MKRFKNILLVGAGICWLLFAAVIGLVLIEYLTGGAGWQVFGFLSPLTVVMGVGQMIGFAAAAGLCGIIGLGLCVHGLVPTEEVE